MAVSRFIMAAYHKMAKLLSRRAFLVGALFNWPQRAPTLMRGALWLPASCIVRSRLKFHAANANNRLSLDVPSAEYLMLGRPQFFTQFLNATSMTRCSDSLLVLRERYTWLITWIPALRFQNLAPISWINGCHNSITQAGVGINGWTFFCFLFDAGFANLRLQRQISLRQ